MFCDRFGIAFCYPHRLFGPITHQDEADQPLSILALQNVPQRLSIRTLDTIGRGALFCQGIEFDPLDIVVKSVGSNFQIFFLAQLLDVWSSCSDGSLHFLPAGIARSRILN